METKAPLIGVLALQGDVIEHVAAMRRAGAQAIPVKNRADLARVCGLIVPGGESTTVMKLLHRFQMDEPIVERVRAGMPLWGTCMGMIVIARDVVGLEQPSLDLVDISVRRNAFGRQNESAEVELPIPALGGSSVSRPSSFARRGSSAWVQAWNCWRNATVMA